MSEEQLSVEGTAAHLVESGNSPSQPTPTIPWTPAVKNILANAHRLARVAKDEHVRIAHLQAAINIMIQRGPDRPAVSQLSPLNSQSSFTFTLAAPTQEAIDAKLIEHLRAEGYHVAPPHENWETPTQLFARLGLRSYESFHKSLRAWEARGYKIPTVWSSPGRRRLVELVSNPAFDAFCRRNKK